MIISVDGSALKQTGWHEYTLRFVMGWIITVAAGLIAQKWGPSVGGLFLAFPAIAPATATLIAKHESDRKSKLGLQGRQRGIGAAAVDVTGGVLGSVGLVAFAAVNWRLLIRFAPTVSLPIATTSWFVTAGLAWWFWKRRHRRERRGR